MLSVEVGCRAWDHIVIVALLGQLEVKHFRRIGFSVSARIGCWWYILYLTKINILHLMTLHHGTGLSTWVIQIYRGHLGGDRYLFLLWLPLFLTLPSGSKYTLFIIHFDFTFFVFSIDFNVVCNLVFATAAYWFQFLSAWHSSHLLHHISLISNILPIMHISRKLALPRCFLIRTGISITNSSLATVFFNEHEIYFLFEFGNFCKLRAVHLDFHVGGGHNSTDEHVSYWCRRIDWGW